MEYDVQVDISVNITAEIPNHALKSRELLTEYIFEKYYREVEYEIKNNVEWDVEISPIDCD